MFDKILRINMSDLNSKYEEIPEKYKYLGGRSLTSNIIAKEVNPLSDPLGEENKLVIAPGLLIGGGIACSGRLSVGAKSPLTGGIKESNSGGSAAQSIAKLRIKTIIIEGMPKENQLYILKIDEDGVEFIPAIEYANMGNYELNKELSSKYGDKVSIMSIGGGGERLYPISSIAVRDMDGYPTRHFGRGGLGAVMGSKSIKAIIIDPKNVRLQSGIDNDEKLERYKSLRKKFAIDVSTRQKGQTKYGTAVLVDIVNKMGILPTQNFRYGSWDKADNINGEMLRKTIIDRDGKPSHICHPGCVIRCSNVYNDAEGNHVTSGFEYETIALLGSNLLIDNLDTIALIDRFCDDFGIDTIDFGVAIGVAMEAGEIEFGDEEAVLGLRDRIMEGEALGDIIARGAEITGKTFGVDRVPTVKGQAIAAYDPRGLKGTGTTYATSPMGADHTAANILPGRIGYTYKNMDTIDIIEKKGQVQLSKEVQILVSICDSMGLCFFVGPTLENCELFAELISIRNSIKYSVVDIIKMGEDTLKLEYEYNKLTGISSDKNDLPEFFRTEPLGKKQYLFDVSKEELADMWEDDF